MKDTKGRAIVSYSSTNYYNSWIEQFKIEITKKTFGLLFLGVVLNALGRFLASLLILPFWLDTVGTTFVAILCGPTAGALVGGISNLIFNLGSFEYMAYILVNVAVGIVVGLMFPKNAKDSFQIMFLAILLAVVVVVLSTPLNIYYYKGYTGNIWGDAMYDMLSQNGSSVGISAVIAEGFVDVPDKVLTIVLALGMVHLYKGVFHRLGKDGTLTNEKK